MKTFEDELIEQAFEKCYGLKGSLQKAIETKDKLLYEACIHSLQINTGLVIYLLTSKFPYDGNS